MDDFFVMGGIQGLTHGFSIVIAQLFGKQDFAGLKKAVICAALLSVFLTKVVAEYGVFWGEIFAWAGAGLLLLFGFFWLMYSRKSVTNRLIFRAASAFAQRLRISSRITFVSIITFQFSRLPLCLHLV